MVTILVVIVVVGLGVALFEIGSSRRSAKRDTRAQLDALSRVVEPQRRDRRRRSAPDDGETDEGTGSPPSSARD